MIKNNKLSLKYKDIILRNLEVEDIENFIKWNSTEIEWMDWDAPWENHFIEENVLREKINMILNRPLERIPGRLQIVHYVRGHVGSVSTYLINGDAKMRAVGISIPEVCHRNLGIGEKALKLWIAYLLDTEGQENIYCETWSGNRPMVSLAEKCGFIVIDREINKRLIRGQYYDGLLFRLDRNSFMNSNANYMNCVIQE